MQLKLRKSDFVHVFDVPRSDYVGLYHSLTMDLVYLHRKFDRFLHLSPSSVDNNEWNNINQTLSIPDDVLDIAEKLIDQNFLITDSNDDSADRRVKQKARDLEPEISVMYLLLTGACNLNCRYCTVNYNIGEEEKQHMSEKTVQDSVKLFSQLGVKDRNKSIVFFGGEPLLNLKGLGSALQEINYYFPKEELDLSLISNGVLINDQVADLIKDNDIFPILSIDGPERIHNSMRIYHTGLGSYNDVIKGFSTLKKKGVRVGISTLVGKHNFQILPEIVEFFASELDAFNLGITLPHLQPEVAAIDINEVYPMMIEAWEVARDRGFYIVQIGKKLQSFVNQQIRLRACPGGPSWSMLRVLPGGNITPCENMGFRGKYVIGNVSEVSSLDNLLNHPVIHEWNERTQCNIDECWKCYAFGICGGGCPYDAYLATNSILSRETRNCLLSRKILEWAIRDLGMQLVARSAELKNKGFYTPSKDDRGLVLGKTLQVLGEHKFLREDS